VDFGDRFILGMIGAPVLISVYYLLGDLAFRANLPVQYYNAYMYPRLFSSYSLVKDRDRDRDRDGLKNKFIFHGVVCFLLLLTIAILVIPFAELLVSFYLGEGFREYGYILILLLVLASFQTLNLFVQSLLRVEGSFELLQQTFRNKVVMFVFCAPLFYFAFGVSGFLAAIVFLKSPSLVVFSQYVQQLWGRGRLFIAAVILICSGVIYFLFYDLTLAFVFGGVFYLSTIADGSIIKR
jgi:hypothetical protein